MFSSFSHLRTIEHTFRSKESDLSNIDIFMCLDRDQKVWTTQKYF